MVVAKHQADIWIDTDDVYNVVAFGGARHSLTKAGPGSKWQSFSNIR